MIGHTIYGNGPVHVLVLHGWLGDSSVFDPILPAIDPTAFTFAFMDYRGYGKSQALAGAFTLDEIAADAIALADHLGWQRFNLMGHSMGGKAALRVAASHPDRVERLVAATPVPAAPVPFEAQALALFEGAAGQIANRQAIIDISSGSRLPKAWSRALAEKSGAVSAPAAVAAYFNAWAKGDFSAQARGLKTQILVLVGEHDPGLNEGVMRATYLADYPNAGLHILPNAGHYPMQETPLSFAGDVLGFLANS